MKRKIRKKTNAIATDVYIAPSPPKLTMQIKKSRHPTRAINV